MLKRAMLLLSLVGLVGLSGCHDSQNDADDDGGYDQVGEMRVFDGPRKNRTNGTSELKSAQKPAVASPKMELPKPSKKSRVASGHQFMGELNVDD